MCLIKLIGDVCFKCSCSSRPTKSYLLVDQHEKNLVRRLFCLFVFVALRPMSTAMVIAGRSVHLTTLLPGQA